MLTSVDNVPVRVDDVVEGGPLKPGQPVGEEGVVVGHQTRLGRVMVSQPKKDAQGNDVCDDTAGGNGTTTTTPSRRSCCCAKATNRCRPCKTLPH